MQTAYALESVIDEAVFIIGPILVTVLATTWHPGRPGDRARDRRRRVPLLAAQRGTEPRPTPSGAPDRRSGRRCRGGWVVPLAVVCFALGSMFGAAEVTTVAFADEQGAKSYAGVLLALWALGSLIAGLVTGTLRWRRPAVFRVQVGSCGAGPGDAADRVRRLDGRDGDLRSSSPASRSRRP